MRLAPPGLVVCQDVGPVQPFVFIVLHGQGVAGGQGGKHIGHGHDRRGAVFQGLLAGPVFLGEGLKERLERLFAGRPAKLGAARIDGDGLESLGSHHRTEPPAGRVAGGIAMIHIGQRDRGPGQTHLARGPADHR